MSIGESENGKKMMPFLVFSPEMLNTIFDLLKSSLQNDDSELGLNQKRAIGVLMRMILQRVLELEKEEEERTVYWHLRQGRLI